MCKGEGQVDRNTGACRGGSSSPEAGVTNVGLTEPLGINPDPPQGLLTDPKHWVAATPTPLAHLHSMTPPELEVQPCQMGQVEDKFTIFILFG